MHKLRSSIVTLVRTHALFVMAGLILAGLLGLGIIGLSLTPSAEAASAPQAQATFDATLQPTFEVTIFPITPTPSPTPMPITYHSFAAKFVCGYQPPLFDPTEGEPPVKPGNYATEINIHNYQYLDVYIAKKVLILVEGDYAPGREPEKVGPIAFDDIYLSGDEATMDDCTRIWELISEQAGIPPGTFVIGYLVLLSTHDLDVDVVYTAQSLGVDGTVDPTGMSIDVERVLGKQATIPAAPSQLREFLETLK